MMDFDEANRCRLAPGTEQGHYESWFQRANHPHRPLAFWLRHTLFLPRGGHAAPVGELWAVWFDGERNTVHAARQAANIDGARPPALRLAGRARGAGADLSWVLDVHGNGTPLLLLPEGWYERRLPAAKALVTLPRAVFSGHMVINGECHGIDGWQGSLNHNWGRRHTDQYAWGQVSGFPGAPDAFLECATARVKLGACLTPALSPLVLRLDGREYRLNSLVRALRNRAMRREGEWTLSASGPDIDVQAHFSASAPAFAGLRYDNPPGGVKTCLNTKLAACTLDVRRLGQPPVRLYTPYGAAFEILTDDTGHGVPILA